MVSTTEELRSATRRPYSNGSRLVPPGRQRSVPLAVVGVLLCFFGAMVFGALHLRLDHRVAVLTVARPIRAGDIINDGDLRVARVSASGLATVAADDRAAVVGHVAAVSLAPGSLLVRSDLGSPTSLQSGQAVVGVALKAGQVPGVVRPGDRVLIVDTGAAGTADATGAPSTSAASRVQATVAAVSEPPDSPGVTIVSLTVGADDAPAIATAAAAGHVTLVLLPSAP